MIDRSGSVVGCSVGRLVRVPISTLEKNKKILKKVLTKAKAYDIIIIVNKKKEGMNYGRKNDLL